LEEGEKMAKKDEYMQRYLDALKKAKSDKEKAVILNKLYEDGFADGVNEGLKSEGEK